MEAMKIDASEDQVDLDHHDIEAGEQLDFPSCHLGWNSKLAGADDEELLQDLSGDDPLVGAQSIGDERLSHGRLLSGSTVIRVDKDVRVEEDTPPHVRPS